MTHIVPDTTSNQPAAVCVCLTVKLCEDVVQGVVECGRGDPAAALPYLLQVVVV